MFQIDNHNELALESTIPYLLQFPEFYNLVEQSGDRAQIIEDIAWQLLYNLDYQTANGIWLDYIGTKVGQTRIYSPKPTGAFTFGGTNLEGFGKGKFLGSSVANNTKLTRTDASFRNAIKAKIIQNNTDTSVDEVIQSCKLLFNAKRVNLTESYPAGVDSVHLYGSSLIETTDVNALIDSILPAGVRCNHVYFHKFYNLFRNNAFITYTPTIPCEDNFEVSFVIQPDILPNLGSFPIFSQSESNASNYSMVKCYYNSLSGIMFTTAPAIYNDDDTGNTTYNDENSQEYEDSDGDVVLMGGSLTLYQSTSVKITRVGSAWSLYINDSLVDTDTSSVNIPYSQNAKFYLGTSENSYYNSGSLYNLIIKNTTTNTVLLNDSLKANTVGVNNGVLFL